MFPFWGELEALSSLFDISTDMRHNDTRLRQVEADDLTNSDQLASKRPD